MTFKAQGDRVILMTDLRQRIGCQACNLVGISGSPRLTELEIHLLTCPACGETGSMHEFPVPGTWPTEYDGCPAETEKEA